MSGHMHRWIISFWLFSIALGQEPERVSRVHVRGPLIGKERYRGLYPIEPGTLFDEYRHYDGMNRIREALQDEGYWAAAVRDSKDVDTYLSGTKITLTLVPGPHYSIDAIHIVGDNVQEEHLRVVQQHALQRYSGRRASRETIEECLRDTQNILARDGYSELDLSRTVTISGVRTICLTITVRAMQAEHFSSLQEQGIIRNAQSGEDQPILSQITYDSVLFECDIQKKIERALPLNAPLEKNALEAVRKNVGLAWRRDGYLYAVPQVTIKKNNSGVAAQWHARGVTDRVQCKNIQVTGSTVISDTILKRALFVHEGDFWDQKNIDRSLKWLNSWGIFESISIFPETASVPVAYKDVVIRCVDDDPNELSTYVGTQIIGRQFAINGATYAFGATGLRRNPLCVGDRVAIVAEVTTYKKTFEGKYRRPLYGVPIMAEVKGYGTLYDQPVLMGERPRLYTVIRHGALISATFYGSRSQSTGVFGCETENIESLTSTARALDYSPALTNVSIPQMYGELSYIAAALDNQLYPTSGVSFFGSAKGVLPMQEHAEGYFKILGECSVYMPWSFWGVVATRLRGGYIMSPSFMTIPPPERFYLGGSRSLRSYPPDIAPPTVRIFECGQWYCVPRGGAGLLNVNVELRFPLLGPLGAVIFCDSGFIWAPDFGKNISTALGCGLRYNTMLGPLRFDIGWNIPRIHGASAHAWFLTFGNAF